MAENGESRVEAPSDHPMGDGQTAELDEVGAWLERLRQGDAAAVDRLVPLLYDELRSLARGRRRGFRVGDTLATTALVHEAYLKLQRHHHFRAEDRAQFLALAGVTMRRILLDHARAQLRQKRGDGRGAQSLDGREEQIAARPWLSHGQAEEMLELDDALRRLKAMNPEGEAVVSARFFAGLSLEETAEVLGVSSRTVRRRWHAARAWLRKEIGDP